LVSGVSECFVGLASVKSLFELWDGVFWGDLRSFGLGAEEGADVEAGEGFYFVAVAFAALSFWWDYAVSTAAFENGKRGMV
jgi:hypothetical protein